MHTRAHYRKWLLLAGALALAQALRGEEATTLEWTDGRHAERFVCRANFRLAEVEDTLFGDLARLERDLTDTLQIRPASSPVELFLFRDRDSYRNYVEQAYPEVPYRRALFVKCGGQRMVYAYRGEHFEVDLRHEMTHALLHSSLPCVPLWLDEGLAEYFEVAETERAGGHPYMEGQAWRGRLGLMQRLSALEQKQELSEMGKSEYRSSWAWMHFMLHGPPEAREELLSYLQDLRADVPAEPLSRRLERRLPGVDGRLLEHFQEWR